jgi:hypothetical protein
MSDIKTIYKGGYVRDLGIALDGSWEGWLFFKHPDGQWVSLANIKAEFDKNPTPPSDEALEALDELNERFNIESERQAGIYYRKIRAALQKQEVDLETLQEELEEIIFETHDIDVQDKHYAMNIIDHLRKYKGWVIK